jgi:hypothetical protein
MDMQTRIDALVAERQSRMRTTARQKIASQITEVVEQLMALQVQSWDYGRSVRITTLLAALNVANENNEIALAALVY